MSDEDQINQRLKDAARSYEPEYDQMAWEGMSAMLEKHLPVERKRRKWIIWIGLLALTGGVVGIFLFNTSQFIDSHPSGIRSEKSLKDVNNASTPDFRKGPSNLIIPKDASPGRNTGTSLVTGAPVKNKRAEIGIVSHLENQEHPSSNASVVKEAAVSNPQLAGNDAGKPVSPTESKEANPATFGTKTGSEVDSLHREVVAKEEPALKTANPKLENSGKKKDQAAAKDLGNSLLKRLSLELSAGPDVSSAGLNHVGKITMIKGISLSYRLGNRYFLRSGFLIAKKIYTVGSGSYGSAQYNPGNNYLQAISSNCTVYEVPLTAGYYLNSSENHSWFLDVGLSTYFMKKESYEYFYKYPTGQTNTKYYSVINQNRHYFSILDISGGYEHALDKHVRIAIEPYLKIPVTGIGVQRIKLNSAGILFSLKWSGFSNH